MKPIKKAVFPVAGLGSRFLPATKANPKEMLPIVDKPLIQYAVEEAIQAGMTEMIFVTSSSKRAIEDHFDMNYELEARLQARDKQALLAITRNIIPKGVDCVYVRQAEPRGLGDAVLCAEPIVGNEPFAVLLADDLFDCPDANCMQQLLQIYAKTSASIVAVESLQPEDLSKYGVVGVEDSQASFSKMHSIVEKPEPSRAPSNLGVAGRYVLSPTIFSCLKETAQGSQDEVQLTDAINLLLKREAVYAYHFTGKRYDCGGKLGYLKATLAFALKHPEVGEAFSSYLAEIK